MNNSFEYELEHIEEIHGLVEELGARSESGVYRVLMDHQEQKNAVRGYSESLRYNDLPESKRLDGGLTWYHDPDNSKCFMIGAPKDNDNKNNEEVIDTWGSLIQEQLDELGYETIQLGADIYDTDGNQIVGLSADNRGDSTVVRGCWYEETPEVDEFLEADGVDKKDWYGSVSNAEGLYDKLMEELNFEKAGEDFISEASYEQAAEYMYREEGEREGTCVNGEIK